MKANTLEGIKWYVDEGAKGRAEPGICHSFMASLATAINYIEGEVDPTRLMGASGFAFRIFMNKGLCPSAMSMFDFSAVLPEAVEQAGYRCRYVSRMWDEGALEEQRREEACAAIAEGIKQGEPAIVWYVADCEWGILKGYDDKRRTYAGLAHDGREVKLKYKKLGKNGIDILSVSIPGERNDRGREDVVRNSLEMAVDHAEQREYIDRPDYQNGLAGLEMWADVMDAGAKLAEAGKLSRCGKDALKFAEYYASCYCGARCYARDYLKSITDGDKHLNKAAACYEKVAADLRVVWECFTKSKRQWPESKTFKELAQSIREAKETEKQGIAFIKTYLGVDT
ncbi:MAG: hypothetical protein JSW59_20675 [Phycisphaerales bacterium]|nr:MAG: hypothetical protein JSW59_20675 [Phycisphaerales bacterium]